MEPTFDFNKYSKSIGKVGIITEPTVHIAKNGQFHIYQVDENEAQYVRISRQDNYLGFKFIYEKDPGAYSLMHIRDLYKVKAAALGKALKLDELLGDDVSSINCEMIKSEEQPHTWYCDLTKPTLTYSKK